MLNLKTAKKIISEVVEAMKGWSKLVVRLEISKREMDMFAGVLDGRVRESIEGYKTIKRHK